MPVIVAAFLLVLSPVGVENDTDACRQESIVEEVVPPGFPVVGNPGLEARNQRAATDLVHCEIRRGNVDELLFLHDGTGAALLVDGTSISFDAGTRGAWLAAAGAAAGVRVRAAETPELVQTGTPAKKAGNGVSLPGVAALGLSFLFVAWWTIRHLRGRRGRVTVGGRTVATRRGDDVPETRFSDVAGCKEAIEDLREIVDVLRNPDRFAEIGARTPRGALLVGPPGTGKTLLARAVAGESGVPFFPVAGSDFVEMYVGVGARRVRDVFEKARRRGKAIVFIDEIDAVGRKRSSAAATSGEQEHENTLVALLNELDGFRQTGVIVLAATNRPEVLDDALCRPGRLDRRIHVGLPDLRERGEIVAVHLRGKNVEAAVSPERVARGTAGMSGAQLEQVCNEAALLAARDGRASITEQDIDGAVAYVALGRARKSALVSAEQRTLTAWHESGHAVVALRYPGADRPRNISIVPRGQSGGATWLESAESPILSRQALKARLVTALGGRAGEELLLDGEHTAGAADDLRRATDIAREMVDRFGMTGRGLSVRDSTDRSSGDAVEELLQEALAEARRTITDNRALLEGMVTELLANDEIDDEAIRRLDAEHANTVGA
jgi:cell division protease FtsH